MARPGGFADYVIVPHPRYLIDIDGLDEAEAAPLACAGVTTYSAINKLGDRIDQEPVLIIGAGGLGLMAIEVLKAKGVKGAIVVDIDPRQTRSSAGRGRRFDNRDIGLSTRFAAAGVPDVAAAFMASSTGRPVTAPYLLTDMARDSIGLLDALGIARAHVVGSSMGGMIAQTMAIQRPERVASLTSIMSSTGEPGLPGPTPAAGSLLLKPAPVEQAAYIENFLGRWKLLRAVAFPEDEALDFDLAKRDFARGLNPAGVARQLIAILASGSRKEVLGSLRVPTLVLHGDLDPLMPLACGAATHRAVPGSKFVVFEGMGHALPIRRWSDIIDAIAAHAV